MVLQQNDYAFAEISTYLDLNSDNTFLVMHLWLLTYSLECYLPFCFQTQAKIKGAEGY